MLAAAGAGPWPPITSVSALSALWKMIGTSPPGPLRWGSTTWRANPAATAASKALPPDFQYGHASRRGQPVRGGNHAVGTDELRPGGEHAATLGNAVASGDPVLRTDLAPYGFFVAAGFGGVRATGPEPAPRRWVHRRRHVAFQDHAFALQLDVGVGDGDRGEQSLGVWVQRVAVELIAGRHLYHHAEVHNPFLF